MRALVVLLLVFSISVHAQKSTTNVFLFEYDKIDLTPDSKERFRTFLSELKEKHRLMIEIAGHTDHRGTEDYNVKLSFNRALAIKAQIREVIGVPSENISVTGHASLRPATLNENESHLNRRVEIIVHEIDESEEIELERYRFDVETQIFDINLDDTVVVYGKEGTMVKIPPGALQKKNGLLAKGNATLILKEYYKPQQIISAGLQTTAEGDLLLQAGGMFFWTVVQIDTLHSKTRKPVEVRMPMLNEELVDMNVFTMQELTDSSDWQDDRTSFTTFRGYWNFPHLPSFPNKEIQPPYRDYRTFPVGRTFVDEGFLRSPLISFTWRHRPLIKRFHIDTKKTSDTTLLVTSSATYRRKGIRAFGKRSNDTAYTVKWKRSEYRGFTGTMNWVNCDRFLLLKDPINMYVKTPGFKNMDIIVYFKNIRSYLHAGGSNVQGNKILRRIPPNTEVTIIAVGKKDGEIYFAKQDFVTEANALATLKLSKKTQKEFDDEMGAIN